MYEIYCKLRDAKELKDAEIAKKAGITRSTFSDWKNGRSTPKHEKLIKIADVLGVSIEYLTTGKEPEYSIEIATIDVELSNMNDRLKEYALKLANLPKDKQEHVMKLIDMLGD